MRISILPLVIILLCSSVIGFSQVNLCANAYSISGDVQSCGLFNIGPLGPSGTNFNPVTGCAGTNGRRVTWFTFTPTQNIMAASFVVTLDVAANIQAAFYNPASACGMTLNSPNSVLCSPTGALTLQPAAGTILLKNKPYYVRVYADVNDALVHQIQFCYKPVTIQNVPVVSNGACSLYTLDPVGTGSNFNPFATGGASCGYAANRRVTWFSFTPSSTITCATFNITLDASANTEVALFDQTGAYQSGSTLCMPNGSGIWAPSLPFTFTVGQTYYLRIYTDINDGNTHQASICAKPYAQPNDLCSSATRLDNNGIQDNNVCATGSVANGGTEPAWITSASNTLLCAPVLQNTAWYYFVVNDNTQSTMVSVSSVNCSNYGGGGCTGGNCNGSAGIQLGLLQGPSLMSSCVNTNALFVPPNTPTHCYQTTATAFGFTVPPNASIPNGTKMYIAVDGYSGANCSYIISTSNAIPIPVKLKYFTVWKQPKSNELRWITSWETNNKNFEIERSFNGSDFSVIGSVPGTGTSTTDVQYKFDDNEAPLLAYYRLKQIDIDGKYEYSNVIIIKRDASQSLFSLAFENPVHNSSVITISTERAGTTTLRVIDVSGRELTAQIVDCGRGNNTVVKDFSRLVAGSYYLIATQGENRVVKPFIKQ